MAVRQAELRLLLVMRPDVGEEPSCSLDTAALPSPLPILTAFKVARTEEIALAAAAADQALTFTDAIGIILVSDEPFDMRLAAAQKLLTNLRLYAVWADDNADGVDVTSVLLTGNGVNEAHITAYIIEKP